MFRVVAGERLARRPDRVVVHGVRRQTAQGDLVLRCDRGVVREGVELRGRGAPLNARVGRWRRAPADCHAVGPADLEIRAAGDVRGRGGGEGR